MTIKSSSLWCFEEVVGEVVGEDYPYVRRMVNNHSSRNSHDGQNHVAVCVEHQMTTSIVA